MVKYDKAFLIGYSSQFLISQSKSYTDIADRLTQPKIDCYSQLKMLCHILPSNLLQQPIFSFSVEITQTGCNVTLYKNSVCTIFNNKKISKIKFILICSNLSILRQLMYGMPYICLPVYFC